MILQPFQKRFLKNTTRPEIDTLVLSLPRGNGKSTLAGWLASQILDPDNDLFRPGTESVLCAASIEQARIVFKVARDILEPMGGYRFLDSHTRIGINHVKTRTRLRVIGSNGKTAFGLLNCPWAICDEPGSWEINGGQMLWDAIETALGKPDSPMKVLVLGTLAPMATNDNHWWYRLVHGGSRRNVSVMHYAGDPKTWDEWSTILKANPLTKVSPEFRRKLRQERDDARVDSRLKARFLSYRMNQPTADSSTVLLTADEWERVLDRPEQPRDGQPVVSYDLGHGRAWSAALAAYSTGRVECFAVAPGIPDLESQERRDRVPAGTYRQLHEAGSLLVADGCMVQPPEQLVDEIQRRWGAPLFYVADRFFENKMRDLMPGAQLDARVWRWSEATSDIRALRASVLDGNMNIAGDSRNLLTASLAATVIKNDDAGNTRLIKKADNSGRDDVAATLVLSAGAIDRHRPFAEPETPAFSGFTSIPR